MKLTSLLTAGALVASMNAAVVKAEPAAISADQKKQFEKIVHDYIVANPEVLVEASQVLQHKQQETMQKDAKLSIAKNIDALLAGDLSVSGNPKGNVTLVEFFDYQCIHCKKMEVTVHGLVQKNKDLRVVYKEFPIFGKESEMAAKVAMAAAMQNKYLNIQAALFKETAKLNEAKIMEIAKGAGLDMAKLKTDMESKVVADTLKNNRELAEKIHLMGTPAFVVISTPNGKYKNGSESAFIPGGASEESLQDLINKAK